MSVRSERPRSPVGRRPRISLSPTRALGRWAVGLAVAFFPLVFAAALVPRAAALGFVCGLAGGVAALLAITRDQERALTVFAALVPLAIAVAFALAEVITGNPSAAWRRTFEMSAVLRTTCPRFRASSRL